MLTNCCSAPPRFDLPGGAARRGAPGFVYSFRNGRGWGYWPRTRAGVPPWQDRRGLIPSKYDELSAPPGGRFDCSGGEDGKDKDDPGDSSSGEEPGDACVEVSQESEREEDGEEENQHPKNRGGWKGRAKALARRTHHQGGGW